MVKKISVHATEEELLSDLASKLEASADEAINKRNIFKVGLSGGSLVQQLAKTLPKLSTDLSKWKFFFCDERVVPFDDEDSTFGAYMKAFSNVNVSEDQFVVINPNLDAEEAAKNYIKKLSEYFPPNDTPRFDVLLLGMGPDGHTCSLFPDHPLLNETSVWVAPITNSPKSPPCRITLTFPVLNNAQRSIFVVLGENKASAIKKIHKDNEALPAGQVNSSDGDVIWLLDKAAAAHIA